MIDDRDGLLDDPHEEPEDEDPALLEWWDEDLMPWWAFPNDVPASEGNREGHHLRTD
jgi:hypothetical protein